MFNDTPGASACAAFHGALPIRQGAFLTPQYHFLKPYEYP